MTIEARAFLAEVADRLVAGTTGADRRLAERFADAVDRAAVVPSTPSRVPCVDELSPNGDPLWDQLLALDDVLPWVGTPRVGDGGRSCAIADFGACLDLGTMNVGAMAVAPNGGYPEHDHPPHELYLVLGGPAEWRWGGAEELRTVRAGDVIVNPPMVRHRVETGDEPVLAVWVLDT